MISLKTKLIVGAIIQALLLGCAWVVQDWRYSGKIAEKEVTYLASRIAANRQNQELLDEKQELADKAAQDYAKQIQTLNATVVASTNAISGLRKQTSDLRTQLDTLSDETVRAYARQASESLLTIAEEHLALSEEYSVTARKADEYYLAWQALDRAWPKTIKENENVK